MIASHCILNSNPCNYVKLNFEGAIITLRHLSTKTLEISSHVYGILARKQGWIVCQKSRLLKYCDSAWSHENLEGPCTKLMSVHPHSFALISFIKSAHLV